MLYALEKVADASKGKNTEEQKVITNFSETIDNQLIKPLLLLPLVENAFKHVAGGASEISIAAEVVNHVLYFNISNPFEPVSPNNPVREVGGIGLTNIRRRLELLYAGRYALHIEQKEQQFSVALQLTLTPQPSGVVHQKAITI